MTDESIKIDFGEILPIADFDEKRIEFPTDALPEILREYVHAESEFSQTSEEMAGTFVLGVLASCLQGKCLVAVNSQYMETLSFYGIVVAGSGERKSSVISAVTRPIVKFSEMMNRKMEPEIKARERERFILQKKIDALEMELDGHYDAIKAKILTELKEELESKPEIKRIRYFADDCTSEALVKLLAENNGRMSIISSEGGVFDNFSKRYTNGKASIDVLLKAHCGDPIMVDRVGRDSLCVDSPALSMILGVQPCVLESLMYDSMNKGKGLLARFTYSFPKSRIGTRRFSSRPVPEIILKNYEKLIFDLCEYEPEIVEVIELSDEANSTISHYFSDNEMFLCSEEGIATEWGNKYIGFVLRVAGLLYKASGDKGKISDDMLHNAMQIGEYYKAQAMYAYYVMGADKTIARAKYVKNRIQKLGLLEIKRNELFHKCRSKELYRNVEEFKKTIDLLEEKNMLWQERPSGNKRGNPPDVIIHVNPKLLEEK